MRYSFLDLKKTHRGVFDYINIEIHKINTGHLITTILRIYHILTAFKIGNFFIINLANAIIQLWNLINMYKHILHAFIPDYNDKT